MSELATWWTALVLPWLAEATIVSAIALALLLVLRRRSAHLRAAIATLAMAKVLLPPLLLPSSLLPWRLVLWPHGATGAGSTDLSVTGLAGLEASPQAPSWVQVVAALHLLGAALAACRCGVQVLALRRLAKRSTPLPDEAAGTLVDLSKRLGLSRPPAARLSNDVEVPFVTGIRRATLYLPPHFARLEGIDRDAETWFERVRPVLAHELVHVRARDPWLAWLGTLARIVWWFHPLVRVLVRAGESAREQRCDDVVLAESLAGAGDYARALLDAAERAIRTAVAPPPFVSSSLGRPSSLARRLDRITELGLRRRRRLTGSELALLILLAVLALPASTRSDPRPRDGEAVRWIHVGGDSGHRHDHGHAHGHPAGTR